MKRRLFIGAAAAALAACGSLSAHTPCDWEMIIGGCRSGKSTIGARGCKEHGRSFVMGFDIKHCIHLRNAFNLNNDVTYVSGRDASVAFDSPYLHGDFLWIDEYVECERLLEIASRFKRVLWTTYPSKEVEWNGFYRHCLRRGKIVHRSTLPQFRAEAIRLCRPGEIQQRIHGRFTT